MKKTIFIGTILVCFLMLMIPNINAFEYQTVTNNIQNKLKDTIDTISPKFQSFKNKLNEIKENNPLHDEKFDFDITIIRVIVLFVLFLLWISPSLWTGFLSFYDKNLVLDVFTEILWFIAYISLPILITADFEIPDINKFVNIVCILYIVAGGFLSIKDFSVNLQAPGKLTWFVFHLIAAVLFVLNLFPNEINSVVEPVRELNQSF